jgi:hypothetical protein
MKAKRKHHKQPKQETTQRGSEAQQSAPLQMRWRSLDEQRWYIAIHAKGFAGSTELVEAISAAQESVEFTAKPSQLAIYVAEQEIEPTGFVTWPKGAKPPRLVGLTNTHQGWLKKK